MKSGIKKISCVAILAGICVDTNSAFAAQALKVKDGDTVAVTVSARELTRLTTKNSRIKEVWASNDAFESSIDSDAGDVFIKPNAGAPRAFSFFVRDENGVTVTVVATQQDVPSETIIFESTRISKPSDQMQLDPANNDTRKAAVRNMIKAMTSNDENGYLVTAVDTEVPLWKEAKVMALKSYENGDFIGTKYVLKNVSRDTMNLLEEEFLDFGKSVIAVGLSKNEVKPNETTYLYVVRKNKPGQE